MLTAEQYTYLQELRQSLLADVATAEKDIENLRAFIEARTASLSTFAEREAFWNQPGMDPEMAVVRENRQAIAAAKAAVQSDIDGARNQIAAHRDRIRALKNRLGIFRLPALKSEIAAYERAHG